MTYPLSGGGYGGNADHDGLANGCSTIGTSKAPPIEIMDQKFPVFYRHFRLHEGSRAEPAGSAAVWASITNWNSGAARRGQAS